MIIGSDLNLSHLACRKAARSGPVSRIVGVVPLVTTNRSEGVMARWVGAMGLKTRSGGATQPDSVDFIGGRLSRFCGIRHRQIASGSLISVIDLHFHAKVSK